MNAVLNFLGLSTNPARQDRNHLGAETAKNLFSRALAGFNDFYLETLAPFDLGSEHIALVEQINPAITGGEHIFNLNEHSIDLIYTEHTPVVEQQEPQGRIVVELLWDAEHHLALTEAKVPTNALDTLCSTLRSTDHHPIRLWSSNPMIASRMLDVATGKSAAGASRSML